MTRIALALGAVGLLPLALLAWRLIGLNRDALEDQVLATHTVAAQTAARRVEGFLEERRTLARILAANVGLSSEPVPEAMTGVLYGLLEARHDIDAAVVLDAAGGEVVRAQRIDPGSEVERLLAAPDEGGIAVSASREAGCPRWIRIDAAVAEPEVGGHVRLLCRGAPLAQILASRVLGPQARLSLLDREGRVVAGAPLSRDEIAGPLLELARSGRLAGSGRFPGPAGREVVAAYHPVAGTQEAGSPGAGWFILSRQSAELAEHIRRRMLRDSGGSVALALALIAALSAAVFVTVVRPLRQLTRVQRRLAGLRGTPGGGSEIDQLKASFAALERSLRQREEVEKVFLGRYLVQGVLGEGAMGMVFRAWDPRLRRPLALKTVHLGRSLGGEGLAQVTRLLSEAVTAARFNHPHIVAIYDAQDAGEAAFIAMELVDGVTLERYLWRHKTLTPGHTACLGAAVARALAAAHERGVVHHDVKPSNVLLGHDGSIKVTDFGISQILTEVVEKDEAVFGTPGYLPPETLESQRYDERGDLFALGAVVYHCLTGRRPFEGGTYREVILHTLYAEVIPPHRLDPRIPEELGLLVMELLERDPAGRPGSSARVAARLEAIAESLGTEWGLQTPEPPPDTGEESDASPPTRLLRPADRHPRGRAPRVP